MSWFLMPKRILVGSGKVGRSETDVVRMIPYCVAVLRGERSEDNPYRITKRLAVILLQVRAGVHQVLKAAVVVTAEFGSQPVFHLVGFGVGAFGSIFLDVCLRSG